MVVVVVDVVGCKIHARTPHNEKKIGKDLGWTAANGVGNGGGKQSTNQRT
jgi:hypothetical protein